MELSELQPEMQSAALMGAESNKRAPSGFQGVRGKKWTGKKNPLHIFGTFLYLLQFAM